MSSHLKGMDPSKFESMYSTERDAIKYEDFKLSTVKFEDIEPFLSKLPPREIDLLTLYRKYGKNQKDIARMFSVTQGAVSSRLKRALERLVFLRDLPKISEEEIEENLSSVFDPIETAIIVFMKETTCQSKTAKLVNEKFNLKDAKTRMTQVKVRHRFEKCLSKLKTLKETKPELVKYYNLVLLVKNNLYILHEVKLPHFYRGNKAIFTLGS